MTEAILFRVPMLCPLSVWTQRCCVDQGPPPLYALFMLAWPLSQFPPFQVELPFLIVAALQLSGCEEACVPGPATCDGNVVVACTSRGKNPKPLYTRRDCKNDVCVTASDTAFCARGGLPSPQCQDQAEGSTFCDGNEIVACQSGYAVTAESCAAAQACVPVGPSNFPTCVESPSRGDCPEGVEGGACVGTEALRCSDGYVLARASCATADLCFTPTPSSALCFVDGKPSCDPAVRQPTQCIANAPAWCHDGTLVHGPSCNGTCQVDSSDGHSTASCSP